MFSLIFEHKTLTKSELSEEIPLKYFSDYEQEVIRFCREWLTGKDAFTLHTSGSTGIPKPVLILRRHILASVNMTRLALGLKRGDSSLICLNIKYIAGIMMLIRGMEIGMKMTITEPVSLPLEQFPDDTTFDFLSFVPLQMQEMLNRIPEKIVVFNRAKAIILGGAGINDKLETALQQIQSPVWHTYGMTETVSHIALRRLNGKEKADYFTVLDGVKIKTDTRNCLVIQSPTAETEINTNDMVELLSENTFKFLGRTDNIVNSGGVKVQAEKIEKAIAIVFDEHKINIRFFVGGLADEKFGEAVTLFVEYAVTVTLEQIRECLLKQGISKYELPVRLIITEKFDETPTGKTERKKMIQKLDFYIRQAEIDDAKLLADMSRKTFYDAFIDANNPEDMEKYMSEAFAETTLEAEILDSDETFFIAYESGKVAGYAKIRKKNPYLPDINALELQRLYVLDDFQGKRIGQKLLDYSVNAGKSMAYEWLWLGVWEHNTKAIAFYEKNGFELFSSHSFMLGTDKQTDLLMKRRIF